MKELGPIGGCAPSTPPRSANVYESLIVALHGSVRQRAIVCSVSALAVTSILEGDTLPGN